MSRRERIVKKQQWVPIFSETAIQTRFLPFRPDLYRILPDQTAFDAPAAAFDFGPLRFSKKLANMALARAGKRRWIRSMR
jgi:hypothetical protein